MTKLPRPQAFYLSAIDTYCWSAQTISWVRFPIDFSHLPADTPIHAWRVLRYRGHSDQEAKDNQPNTGRQE